MNEESIFEIASLRRECMELRADIDAMRKIVEALSVGGWKLGTAASIVESGGTDVVPQTAMFVPPTDADGVSIDEKEDEEGEEDNATGCLQIKGFAGKNKIDPTNLDLTEYPSSDEFLCRTSGGELKYRKLTASGGGSPVSTVDVEVVVGATYDTYTHKFTLQKKKLTVLTEQSASDTEVFEATSHAAEHGGTL